MTLAEIRNGKKDYRYPLDCLRIYKKLCNLCIFHIFSSHKVYLFIFVNVSYIFVSTFSEFVDICVFQTLWVMDRLWRSYWSEGRKKSATSGNTTHRPRGLRAKDSVAPSMPPTHMFSTASRTQYSTLACKTQSTNTQDEQGRGTEMISHRTPTNCSRLETSWIDWIVRSMR